MSRDYLRRLCVGRRVVYTHLFSVDSIGRDYAKVELQRQHKPPLCVAEALLRSGYARLRGLYPEEPRTAFYQRLEAAEAAAKASGKGVWTPATRAGHHPGAHPVSAGPKDTGPLLSKLTARGAVPAVVESVRDGSYMYITLYPDGTPGAHTHKGAERERETKRGIRVPFVLAGVRCPRWTGKAEEGPREAEAYAEAAKWFVESRILQRDVSVSVCGVDAGGVLVGQIASSAGRDIAEHILRAGLGLYVPWSGSLLPDSGETLRGALAEAQAKGEMLHSDSICRPSYDALVTEIVNTGVLFVRPMPQTEGETDTEGEVEGDTPALREAEADGCGGVALPLPLPPTLCADRVGGEGSREIRVALQHVTPRKLGRRQHLDKSEPGAVPGLVAMSRLIMGRVVRVHNAEAQTGTSVCASVHTPDGSDLAAVLAGRGYVRCNKDAPQHILAKARTVEWPQPGITNLAVHPSVDTAKQLVERYRGREVEGVVVQVVSGHRLRFYCLDTKTVVSLSLAGVMTPNTRDNDPLSAQSMEYSRGLVLQQVCKARFHSFDRGGGVLASLSFTPTRPVHLPSPSPSTTSSNTPFSPDTSLDLGRCLLAVGLASLVSHRVPEGMGGVYVQAAQRAAQLRVGIHSLSAIIPSLLHLCLGCGTTPVSIRGKVRVETPPKGSKADGCVFVLEREMDEEESVRQESMLESDALVGSYSTPPEPLREREFVCLRERVGEGEGTRDRLVRGIVTRVGKVPGDTSTDSANSAESTPPSHVSVLSLYSGHVHSIPPSYLYRCPPLCYFRHPPRAVRCTLAGVSVTDPEVLDRLFKGVGEDMTFSALLCGVEGGNPSLNTSAVLYDTPTVSARGNTPETGVCEAIDTLLEYVPTSYNAYLLSRGYASLDPSASEALPKRVRKGLEGMGHKL
ncbi:staphylococcal nuclease domain-containing protein 1 [Kipferlia bialata]|uniref:Staphylococcal nuclease domain-containing protein 1 n=1 Tax=Kipferlia bialata TaxID=797122 RepID=A0A9K3GHF2_9EUKA|nr:staphylococcal nuclease domain-containing protein 1 [Kipferlia bialata]GIQ82515.1 staphylococcal nuclease domain-containing protein 1 [Kipferlia bialata]|eukprot:g3502.t1